MGALEADAGQGHWESLQGGSGAPVTTAGQKTREAKRIRGLGWPWRIRGLGWPWRYYFLGRSRQRSHSDPDQSPMHGHYGYQDHGYMPPPPKSFWVDCRPALGKCGFFRALEKRKL